MFKKYYEDGVLVYDENPVWTEQEEFKSIPVVKTIVYEYEKYFVCPNCGEETAIEISQKS